MSLLAATGGSALFLLFVLACPLIMFLMMRTGMHGSSGQQDDPTRRSEMTLDQLKHERDELNELIAQRASEAADRKFARV